MSLQVWLPLNGSLENLGLSDVGEIDTTHISFTDNGKIGKCLTGYTGFFDIPSMTGKKQLSVAYWVKINAATSTQWLDAFRWYSTDGSTTKISRNEFYTNCTLTGFWFQGGSISGKGTTVGKWYHHAFVIDYEAGTAEFYIDGVSVGSSSAVGTTHYLTGTNFMIGESGLDTSHNDFRLYDHYLSVKEVKELSKGLVAHYPLNDFIGNPNLLKNTTNTTTDIGWARAGVSVTTIDVNDEGITTFSNTTSTTLQYGRICQWIDDGTWATVNGKTITISFDIYSDDWNGVHEPNGANSGFAGFAIQIARSTAAPGSGSVNQQQYLFRRLNSTTFWYVPIMENSKWIHFVSKPFVVNEENLDSSSSLTTGDYVHIGWQLRMQGVVKIKNLKVEYGSIATPWIPNEADSLYSALGLDDDIIYDCSGYNHHGESYGPVVGIDPPRYKTCTSFDGTDDYIDLGIDTWLPTEVISIAMWVYMDDWTKDHRPISCTQSGGWSFQKSSSVEQFALYKANGGYCRAKTATLLSELTPGWHHFVGTYDRYVARIYLDGVLDGTSTDGSPDVESDIFYNVNTKLFLGCEAATANPSAPYLDGKLSDVRIYATVLSAENIKALYETSVSIDDKGNFHAYEISEV